MASTAVLTGAHHQSFQGTDFVTAGNDMYLTSFNFSINAPDLSMATGQTRGPSLSIYMRQLRRRLIPFLSRFFRPAHRDAPQHGPQIQGAVHMVPIQRDQSIGNPDTPTTSVESGARSEEDVNVSSMEELDVRIIRSDITRAEIYVRSMLRSGHGLGCWNPKPRSPLVPGKGVTPGDIGTFTPVYGFQKIFNIWDGEPLRNQVTHSPRYLAQAPSRAIRIHRAELREGDTVGEGLSSVVRKTPSGQISSFEFQCRKRPGAVLACTSSADLEELADPIALQEFIIQHAGLIYQHANSIQRVADKDSLYIITGCIKSDSWAVAAYNEMMEASPEVLKLERDVTSRLELTPDYTWTHRGMAEARFGSNSMTTQPAQGGHGKDQALFLRGFKLALSNTFRSHLKGSLSKFGSDSSGSGDTSSGFEPRGDGNRFMDGGNCDSHAGSAERDFPGFGDDSSTSYSSGGNLTQAHWVQVDAFPALVDFTCHPCDTINDILLDTTGANCALCHDDDWRLGPVLDASPEGGFWVDVLKSQVICVRNGVACFQVPEEDHLDVQVVVPEVSNFENAERLRDVDSSTESIVGSLSIRDNGWDRESRRDIGTIQSSLKSRRDITAESSLESLRDITLSAETTGNESVRDFSWSAESIESVNITGWGAGSIESIKGPKWSNESLRDTDCAVWGEAASCHSVDAVHSADNLTSWPDDLRAPGGESRTAIHRLSFKQASSSLSVKSESVDGPRASKKMANREVLALASDEDCLERGACSSQQQGASYSLTTSNSRHSKLTSAMGKLGRLDFLTLDRVKELALFKRSHHEPYSPPQR